MTSILRARHQEQSSWMHPTPRKFAYAHGERRSCMLRSQWNKESKIQKIFDFMSIKNPILCIIGGDF